MIFTLLALLAATSIARASEARIIYYDIAGNSARDLRREMKAKGPVGTRGTRVDGHTKWKVSWRFRYLAKDGGCEFSHFNATVEGTITLPRWFGSSKAPADLMPKWQGFITALRNHENGHYAHGIQAAKDIQALGQSFRVPGACSTIGPKFNAEAAKVIEKYKAADADFDRRTQYGRTEGVLFP